MRRSVEIGRGELFGLAQPLEHAAPLTPSKQADADIAVGAAQDRILEARARAVAQQQPDGLAHLRAAVDPEARIETLHRTVERREVEMRAGAAAQAGRPPNIVLILADDLGYECLRANGATEYKTPNLDRLAAEGMRFNLAFAASSLCSPSRAVIHT